jgi:hypothetical protein
MQRFNLRYKLLTLTVLAFFVWAIAADLPFSFKAGDVIRSEEMNQNFAALNNGKQDLVSGMCAAGSSIRVIAADGTVECEVDDIGSGSGSSGVDAVNGMKGAVTLQAGDNITIDDSTAGQIRISSSSTGGTTYEADEQSLNLNGTTFSIKDGGVSAAKLANGSVTPAKLLPFDATGSYGTLAFSVRNTSAPGAAIALRGIGGDTIGIGVGGPVGVIGESDSGIGVLGGSLARGIVGLQGSTSCAGTYAVGGCAIGGVGIYGRTSQAGSSGVRGETDGATLANAVSGFSTNGVGIYGESTNNAGVFGKSTNNNSAFFTGGSGGSGNCYYNGGAGWNCTSDKNAKENFRSVDSVGILEAVAKLPITQWNMKGDAAKTPHLGPVAQDFYEAFGLGGSDTTINAADAQGVSLAAIQGLYQLVQEQQEKIAELENQLATLQGN